MKKHKKGNKQLTKAGSFSNNSTPSNIMNMPQKELIEKKRKTREGRVKAFSETLKNGVSGDYMKYLKGEAKENRMIEKYL